MSRVVSWKVLVIVILSAVGAVAPLKKGVFAVWSLWDFRARLLLYLTLAGLGVAAYCTRRYKFVFASGLASAALCLWAYWHDVWLPSKPVGGLTEIIPTRVGWGWLIWLAGAFFLCGVAIQEGLREREARVDEHGVG